MKPSANVSVFEFMAPRAARGFRRHTTLISQRRFHGRLKRPAFKLKVTEALTKDVGRALARLGPEDLEKLQVEIGDIVEVTGNGKRYARQCLRTRNCVARSASSWTDYQRECRLWDRRICFSADDNLAGTPARGPCSNPNYPGRSRS